MSLKSLSKAQIALTLSIFGLVAVFLINFYSGIMIFAKYEDCDPLKSGQIQEIDQLVPHYVMESFHEFKGFVGIFVAGIFAASLGTVAACLSSLSAVTIEDLIVSGMNVKLTPTIRTTYAKWMNFGYGVFSFGLIFLIEGRGVLQATLTLNGLIGGLLLGLFSLGIFFKNANLKGAFYGGILTMICVLILGVFALIFNDEDHGLSTSIQGCPAKNLIDIILPQESNVVFNNDTWMFAWVYKISYIWYSAIGTILTIIFGLTISIITRAYDDWKIMRLTQKMNHQDNMENVNNVDIIRIK